MLTRITFEPGAVAQGEDVALPDWAPRLYAVSSAQIYRGQHSHDLVANGIGGAVAEAWGSNAGGDELDTAAAADVTIAGGGASGVQNADAQAVVAAVSTKVDNGTITLSVATLAADTLELVYVSEGNQVAA